MWVRYVAKGGIAAAVVSLAVLPLTSASLSAQEVRVAVIDADRVVAESIKGQEALAKLNKIREARVEQAREVEGPKSQ